MSNQAISLEYRPTLIGLTGYAGAGKDTAARIMGAWNFTKFAFADELKAQAYQANGYVRTLVDQFGWEYAKREYPKIRSYLVRLGTQQKDSNGTHYWTNFVAEKINNTRADNVVVSDVRFPHEAAWIRENGGIVVRIERPGVSPAELETEMASERPVINYPSHPDRVEASDNLPDTLPSLAAQLTDAVVMAARKRDFLPLYENDRQLQQWEAF